MSAFRTSKKQIVFITIALLVLPLLVNICYLFPAPYEIMKKPSPWTVFWGSYAAAIISCLTAFYVLWKQLEQNHIENQENRELNIKILQYQQSVSFVHDLKDKLMDYVQAFDFNLISKCVDEIIYCQKYKQKEMVPEIKNHLKILLDKIFISHASIGFLFPEEDKMDVVEKRILTNLRNITDNTFALLGDLDWYVFTFIEHNVAPENIASAVQAYHQEERSNKSTQEHQFYQIIEDFSYDVYSSFDKILAMRMSEFTAEINMDVIIENLSKLVDHETNKANTICR